MFKGANEVGVKGIGMVPRPPGTLPASVPWKTSQRDKGLSCPRAQQGNATGVERCWGDSAALPPCCGW